VTLWRPGGRSRGIESSAAQNAPSRPTVRAFQAIFTRPGPTAEAAAPCGDFRLRMKCGLDLLTESLSHFDPNVWSGRALQESSSSCLCGLASMYPAFDWSLLLAIMDISALASSLADRPQLGHSGHQCSQAPGRPNLHLISSSRRPRRARRIDLATSLWAPHFARSQWSPVQNVDQAG